MLAPIEQKCSNNPGQNAACTGENAARGPVQCIFARVPSSILSLVEPFRLLNVKADTASFALLNADAFTKNLRLFVRKRIMCSLVLISTV